MRKLLMATRNKGKLKELTELVAPLGIKVLSLDDVEAIPEIIEDGDTFTENAIKKARETSKYTGYICLADDSGLVVEALNGLPGIYSARFAGEEADDEANNRKLLALMQNIKESKRTAYFVSVIALCDTGGNCITVEGKCSGSIALKAKGRTGFGYDPLFIPSGHSRSFAEFSGEEKNKISHRGQALNKAIPVIKKLILGEDDGERI
ncbi:MAG: XTP/dITP diphosphatase [Syntrophomonadaceae bacterium]|nr:XTP/dITP diphosphatase [Syntrophomonadaceae bacterium]